ncbi:MAG: hypothetical protein JWN52_8099, partial [Actinomycetia bacterium]|nr:hypothetical protein [Actinomycetes bacterium]
MARTIAIDLVGRDMLSKSLVAAAESTKALKRSLEELNKRVNVGVDADTGKARAELAAAKAEADRLDGKKADVKVNADAGAAMAAIQSVGMALAGLAAIPVGATLGAGVLALVPSFAAAGIGAAGLAAVAVPAISDIKAALQAQTQAQAHSGAAAVASQSKALAMAGAQQQVASAVRQAAYAHVQALQQVQQAEQSLTQAQQGAVQAQRDLVQARKDAAKQLQDQANNSADAQLAERQATFDLTDAQTNYNKVASNPASTKDQIARAKLVLDQARQNLKERHLATERAIADEKAGAKAGVEGSDAVRQARLKLAQANQQVANAEKSLAQARAGVARADRQSADAVASARRGLTAASLQGAGASNALNAAMAKLSPSARNLMGHWTGLKGAFDSWRKSMEPTVLPIFGRALDMLKGQIPSLTPIVKGAAGAVNGLVTDLGKNAKSPFWSQFKKNLTALVPTALTGFGKTAGNVATGLAGVINAFLPYAPSLLDWIVKISGK